MKYTLDQIKNVLNKKGYKFFDNQKPYYLNIIGIRESMEVDKFNDELYLIFRDNNLRMQCLDYPITTKPGRYWMMNPMNKDGCAILVPDQYLNVYKYGLHKGYPALIQSGNMKVYRDNNKNDVFDTDPKTIQNGIWGLNMHESNHVSESWIVDKYSAACQVMKRKIDQIEFMYYVGAHKFLYGDSFHYTLLVDDDFK